MKIYIFILYQTRLDDSAISILIEQILFPLEKSITWHLGRGTISGFNSDTYASCGLDAAQGHYLPCASDSTVS